MVGMEMEMNENEKWPADLARREKGRYARAAKRLTTVAGSYWSLLIVALGVLLWLTVGAACGSPANGSFRSRLGCRQSLSSG
jgi:hypothetical protein